MTSRIAALGIVALTVWAYHSVWTAAFVFEDRFAASVGPFWSSYRPLTQWTWSVVGSPLGAHLLSLSLFLVYTALALRLVSRLGLAGYGWWFVAIVCLLHPLQTESVAYAASRAELLAAICVLGACVLATGAWWRGPTAAGIVFCLSAATFCKESGIVGVLLVPVVIAVCDRPRPRWLAAWVPAACAGGAILLAVWDYGGVRAILNRGSNDFVSTGVITWAPWIGVQAAAAGYWLIASLTLQGFTPDPDIDLIPRVGRWLSVGVLLALAGVAWGARQRHRLLAGGLAWYLLALAPRLIVQTPQGYLNAHQMLVPCLGLLISAGYGFNLISATAREVRWRRSFPV